MSEPEQKPPGWKPMNHPDYRIPGTDMFSFSRWKRENDPAPPPHYHVGEVVEVRLRLEITKAYPDCDGTPLYAFGDRLFGISEESIFPDPTPEELL